MKLNEMREKTVEELQGAIIDWKKDLFNYKLQLSTHKLENTALISKTKRLIAQAKTVIKEKEVQHGHIILTLEKLTVKGRKKKRVDSEPRKKLSRH